MKLGIFIVVVMQLLVRTAFASPSLTDEARASSDAGDHARSIELYRQAYELESSPALLVRIAQEQRLAGDARQALAYFCSYLYVDAAGDLADEASANARALAAQLGNMTQSDHDACKTKPRAAPQVASVTSVDIVEDVIVRKPPRITKREVAGLAILGGSLVSLGLALYEAGRITDLRAEIAKKPAGTDLGALEDRKSTAQLEQKLFLAGGGVALITGGILYVLGRADRKRQERAYVAPSLTRSGGGLVLGGQF